MNSNYKTAGNVNPTQNASIFSRLSFLYMFPIFFRTYRKGITEDNLYEPLSEHKSSELGCALEELWKNTRKKSPKYALHKALLKKFGPEIIFPAIVKCVAELALLAIVPVAVGKLVAFFDQTQKVSKDEAFFYAGAIAVTFFLVAISFHPAMMSLMHTAMKLRVSCSSMIYRKSLRLGKSALAKTTVGQIVNILSNDVTKFDQGFVNIDYFYIGPLQLAIGTYLLYKEIGVSALFGILFLVSFIPVQVWVGKLTSALRLKTAVRTDERVKLMNEVISGIQVIKMYCWEKPFGKLIAYTRRKEMSAILSHAYLLGMVNSFEIFLTRTSIFISILVYVTLGYIVTAEKVFLVTSIYYTIRTSVTILFSISMSSIAEIDISIKRINDFLSLEELHESGIKESNLGSITLSNSKINNDINFTISKPSDEEIKPKIILRNVSAKWDQNSAVNTLQDINIEITSNYLMAVVGPVGSGKSSLLSTLLKELSIVEGTMNLQGKISYAPQEPWLFSGSIRQNILFGEEYDKRRYAEVVRVCALKSDFAMFQYGDKTLVGERGCSLSGGQKARINLARCVYKQADIYLLDDPLSAVDANVGKYLYQNCIKLFLSGKIRILVTHQIQHIQNADAIVIMENGIIQKIGTYLELLNCGLNFGDLLKEFSEDQHKEKPLSRRASRQSSVFQSIEMVGEEPTLEKEYLSEGTVKYSTYFKFIRAGGGFFPILLLVLAFIFSNATHYGGDIFLRTWVNLEQNHTESLLGMDLTQLQRKDIIWIYTGIIIGVIVFALAYCLYFVKFFTVASINLHNISFGKLLSATMKFFDNNPSGRILNRFSKDLGIVDEYIPLIMYDVIWIFADITGTFAFSIMVQPWLIFPCIVLLIMLCLFRTFYIATSRGIKRIEGITRSPIFGHTTTSIDGLTTIRAFNAQNLLIEEFDTIQDIHSGSWFLFLASNRCFGYWLDVGAVIFITTSVLILIMYSDSIYGGDIGMVVSQYLGLYASLQWGMRQWSELENQMTSVERVLEYTEIETEPKKSLTFNLPIHWPNQGTVEFRNVFLKYNSDESPVLKNLNFKIKSGEKVGIVGRTGAGKSSIISALFQLYPIEGSIFIDNFDITKMPLDFLRNKISIIPQEPVLFSGTVRKNLDPFDELDDHKIWNALQQVELKDYVEELGNGLQSVITERGANFSVGQRQLFCLARALLRNNRILVLDEATANVDPHTDALIQRTIREKFAEFTVLTIAHRLHTVMDSNKILLMSNGTVADYDHPHMLLQKKTGLLYELVEATGPVVAKNLTNVAYDSYVKQNEIQ